VDSAYFDRLSVHQGSGAYRATTATIGPWAAHLQHGGPPNALLVSEAERCAAEATGRADLVALRFAAEFLRPVPVGEVAVRTRVVRAARVVALVEAVLSAGGEDCLQSRVWFVRAEDSSDIAHSSTPRAPDSGNPGLQAGFPYGDSLETYVELGGLREIGPGVFWARPTLPLLEGHEYTGLQRAALIGDSASGVSSALDWTVWSFVNVDLDVHLARPMVGDWLHLDAETQLGPAGSALARSTLSDSAGRLGATLQTLVVEKLRKLSDS
jgi:hypothetical protein